MSESNIARELRELREMQSNNWYKSGGYHLADSQQKLADTQLKMFGREGENDDGVDWISPEMQRNQLRITNSPMPVPSKIDEFLMSVVLIGIIVGGILFFIKHY